MKLKKLFGHSIQFYATWVAIIQYGITFGIETSFVSIYTGHRSFENSYSNPNSLQQGIMTGIYLIAAAIGSILATVFSMKWDKKRIIIFSSFIWLSGYLINCLIIKFVSFLIGRALKGIAIGLLSTLLPLYCKEVFCKSQVGYVLAAYQSALPLGIFYNAVVATAGCLRESARLSFDQCWLISAIPVIPVVVLGFFIRRSPWDALKQSQGEKVPDIIEDIYGEDQVEKVTETLLSKKHYKQHLKAEIQNLIGKNPARKRLMCGVFPQLMVQISGINIIMYYITYICQMAGMSSYLTTVTTLCIYFGNFVANTCAIAFIGSAKRLKILRYGCLALGCLHGAGFLIMSTGHKVPPINGNPSATWKVGEIPGIMVLVICFIFVSIFALSFAGLATIYTTEIIPLSSNNLGIGLAITSGWVTNFCIAVLVPFLFAYTKYFTFFIFCTLCLFSYIVLSRFVETKGLTDEEIDAEFHHNDAATATSQKYI